MRIVARSAPILPLRDELAHPTRGIAEQGLTAYPVLVIGSVALGTSVVMFAAWVGLWLWFIGILFWPTFIR